MPSRIVTPNVPVDMASRPSPELRLIALAFLILAGLTTLVGKLWWVQVAHQKMWAQKISGRSEVTVRIPSVRGEIRDRNGITLLAHPARYEVDFYLPDMGRGYRQEFRKPPVVKYQANVKQMRKEMTEPD